jgi:putative flippase GtrA
VGAVLGFVANGRITFGSSSAARLGRHHFGRFILLWVVMTLLSTWLVSEVALHLSLQMAWLGKPLVEAALAVASFIVSRHWVYR